MVQSSCVKPLDINSENRQESKNSPMLPSRSPLNIGKSLPLFTVLVCGVSLLSFDINSNNILADAQTVAPLAPTFPDNGPGGPTIQITSPQDNQQVPPGELSIQGISSDQMKILTAKFLQM